MNDPRVKIVYEDNHLIVADKPAGVLSQADSSGERSILDMIKYYVKIKCNKKGDAFIGLVHRLDKPVSGLMIFARNSKSAKRLQAEFTSERISKYYLAIITEPLSDSNTWYQLENNLLRDGDITRVVKNENQGTRRARLYFCQLMVIDGYSLILIKLATGRKHQIRSQLTAIGKPIAGDSKYGSHIRRGDGICLHSSVLKFSHPVSHEGMFFYSQPPEYFNNYMNPGKDEIHQSVIRAINSIEDQIFESKFIPFF